MTNKTNRQIVLAARPVGAPKESDFDMVETAVPAPGDGEMLCRTLYLSLDPYMRGRISDAKSYAAPVEIGSVMVGGTVSEVVESNIGGFSPGDIAVTGNGWQEYALSDGKGVRKLDPSLAPISTGVGVLGMPGFTAYVGLLDHGRPKPGETVVVSAASGAVGAVVGQIAKLNGCRAVGIAGAPEKCAYVTEELGFDACVSHRDDNLAEALAAACPNGIDVYFENVGGPVFEAVLPLLNPFSRIPVCGLISQYNATELPPGPNLLPALMRQVLTRKVAIRGFIQSDHLERMPDFINDMPGWIRDGRIKYREDIVDGLENAVSAFQGLLEGRNFGKLLVRVAPDPTA
ncbi:MAG: NADP-dependent oxidoreductase [Minwuiales bacterium]|nr:NADP-dependent oxidoreductase [Minwuiales bacterium]